MAFEQRKKLTGYFSVRLLGKYLLETDASEFYFQDRNKTEIVLVKSTLTNSNSFIIKGDGWLLFPDTSTVYSTHVGDFDPKELMFDIEPI